MFINYHSNYTSHPTIFKDTIPREEEHNVLSMRRQQKWTTWVLSIFTAIRHLLHNFTIKPNILCRTSSIKTCTTMLKSIDNVVSWKSTPQLRTFMPVSTSIIESCTAHTHRPKGYMSYHYMVHLESNGKTEICLRTFSFAVVKSYTISVSLLWQIIFVADNSLSVNCGMISNDKYTTWIGNEMNNQWSLSTDSSPNNIQFIRWTRATFGNFYCVLCTARGKAVIGNLGTVPISYSADMGAKFIIR